MWGRLESTISAVSRAATLTLRRSRVRFPGQFALQRLYRGGTGFVVAAGGGVEFDRHPGLAQHDRTVSSLWRLAWPISAQKTPHALISGAWQGDGGWQCKGSPKGPDRLFIVPDHDVPVVVISLEP